MLMKPFSNLPAYNTDKIWSVTAKNTLFGDLYCIMIGTVSECEDFVKENASKYNELIIEL